MSRPSLEGAWYPLATSGELRRDPLPRSLLGRPLVLFRDETGRPAALEDRCLHRHMPLSAGAVRGGRLECAYHGWQFDARGACVRVPCARPDEPLSARRVPSLAVHEAEGTVWVHPGAPEGPPAWPEELTGPGPAKPAPPVFARVPLAARFACELSAYAWFERITIIECPVLWVINNFVDCAHTGFVHRGLFRSAPSRLVRAELEETPRGVRIQTFGERDPSSLLGTLLVPRGEELTHVDELILPTTVRVDYRFGATRHVLTVSIAVPETETRTRVVTRVGVYAPPLSRVLLPALERTTERILAQDRGILERQAEGLRRVGPDPAGASTAADAPTAWVTRAFEAMCAGDFPPPALRRKAVEYLL